MAIIGIASPFVVIPLQTRSFYNTYWLDTQWFYCRCHTPPNEELLQRVTLAGNKVYDKVVIPLQTRSFYNMLVDIRTGEAKVVIPLQTRSFYNYYVGIQAQSDELSYPSKRGASTTRENPQRVLLLRVVIPLQTRSFYNRTLRKSARKRKSCHTPPNEELLQLGYGFSVVQALMLSYPSKRGASTTEPFLHGNEPAPCCHTPPNEELLQRLWPTKKCASVGCHTPPNEELLQPLNSQ